MDSLIDYKSNAMHYFSTAVPFPDQRDRRYISAVADEIGRLATASHGHAAVLFTSYKVMKQVVLILKERELPYPLFQMGRKDINAQLLRAASFRSPAFPLFQTVRLGFFCIASF